MGFSHGWPRSQTLLHPRPIDGRPGFQRTLQQTSQWHRHRP
ncbi:hypothetical protein ppKF707_2269 [Metapseudomonas furukawaii]|uniref:Uncharacterized protein n=1 Tax=Metapseudomonas furukawaii TaxID=1149133 RepID=A0AAD1BTN9_METFU|nr:hypothetical protein ppKF707_2269 [Pseudomonas furukawaii]BAU71809.1 hypothetical protein KF707C_1210 [Pseudomonas furukawaii]